MRRSAGGFGWVVLLVVVAVVLLLAARAWETVAPTAAEVRGAADAVRPGDARPTTSRDGDGGLPGVDEMRSRTAGHANRVQDALDAAN